MSHQTHYRSYRGEIQIQVDRGEIQIQVVNHEIVLFGF